MTYMTFMTCMTFMTYLTYIHPCMHANGYFGNFGVYLRLVAEMLWHPTSLWKKVDTRPRCAMTVVGMG